MTDEPDREDSQEDAESGREDPQSDPFEGHRTMDVEVTSNLADGASVDVNGTQLFIKQHTRHIPVLVEIWVGDEENPIGSFNTARAETATLGGVDEALAQRVDEIRELPVRERSDALEELAYRLNPAGREKPESLNGGDDGGE